MKATDLRIGNIVQRPYDKTTHVVSGYMEPYVYLGFEGKGNYYSHLSKLEPIPLTEQWLERFGFKYRKSGAGGQDSWAGYGSWEKGDCYFQGLKDGSNLFYARYRRSSCVYVHELQNLYYALTGEELTLKEDVAKN